MGMFIGDDGRVTSSASTLGPHSAPPGHETLAAHARATVEADGTETWPEGLVRDADLWCRLWFERNAGFRLKREVGRRFATEMLAWIKQRSKHDGE